MIKIENTKDRQLVDDISSDVLRKRGDVLAIHRTEKQIDVLRVKGGRTAQTRARARKVE